MANKALIPVARSWGDIKPMMANENPTMSEDGFVAAVKRGVESWETAGKILVHLRNDDPDIFQKIVKRFQFLTIDTLETFYHIGTKSIYAMSVLMPRHIFKELKTMSYETQVKICHEPIQVVSRMENDMPVIIRKAVVNLTPKEAETALWKKGQRSVEVQVKELKSPTPKSQTEYVIPPTHSMYRPLKSVGLYAVRRAIGGKTFVFEPTMAKPYTLQRIILTDGQCVIELTEYEK